MDREYLKNNFTKKLGEVIEEEDKLICYVDKNKCLKLEDKYAIACLGISEENIELANNYNLNKKIVYIFDGIDFSKDRVHIYGYHDCEVIIRNCKFSYDLYIYINGKCTIENTIISNSNILTTIHAKELIIKDMIIIDDVDKKLDKSSRIIGISAEELLQIYDSSIDSRLANVNIESNNELSVSNTKIICETLKYSDDETRSLRVVDNVWNITILKKENKPFRKFLAK